MEEIPFKGLCHVYKNTVDLHQALQVFPLYKLRQLKKAQAPSFKLNWLQSVLIYFCTSFARPCFFMAFLY